MIIFRFICFINCCNLVSSKFNNVPTKFTRYSKTNFPSKQFLECYEDCHTFFQNLLILVSVCQPVVSIYFNGSLEVFHEFTY